MRDKEARRKIKELEIETSKLFFINETRLERELKLLYEFLNIEEKTEVEKTILVKKK